MHSFHLLAKLGTSATIEVTIQDTSAEVLGLEVRALCAEVPAFQAIMAMLEYANRPSVVEVESNA